MDVETKLFEIAPTPLHRTELLCLRCSPWSPVYLDWGTNLLPDVAVPSLLPHNRGCVLFWFFKRQQEDGKYSGLVMTFGEGGIRLQPKNE